MPRPRTLFTLLALLLLASLPILLSTHPRTPPAHATYIGRATCARCHAEHDRRWQDSDHDRAMAVATDSTVLATFDNTPIPHHGLATTPFRDRDADRFLVRTQSRDGALADFAISHVFGVDPLQQYLVEFPDGRKQCLPIAFDTRARRWLHLYPDDPTPPSDPLHWTGRDQNWNWMCAECHSTNLVRSYDPTRDSYATTWSEIDVSCEACHGPGSAHLQWAEASWLTRWRSANAGLCVDLRDPAEQVETCARCHSRRAPITANSHAGERFLDVYRPELLHDGLYEADGTILDEVYEYGSFLQSRMHAMGVRCSDCHDPHQATLHATGNQLCARCHEPTRYDTAAHHHHQDGSTGAACAACHMPQRTYMQVDARRDHSFRVPRPDLSVAHDTPNACTDCHAERGARWAAEATAQWRKGAPPYESATGKQAAWTAAFAAQRRGDRSARTKLEALLADQALPGIVRATALDLLGRDGEANVDQLRLAVDDDDTLVRAAAARAADALAPAARAGLLAPLLADPRRLVRIDAARSLAPLRDDDLPVAARADFVRAFAELEDSLRASAERPESLVTLGAIREERGDAPAAETLYRRAIVLDPGGVPARMNLSLLLDASGRSDEAIAQLETVVTLAPSFAAARYNLGLALAQRDGGAAEALAQLEIAAEGLPGHARLHYNLGLLRQRAGNVDGARQALLRARELSPDDPDVSAALRSLDR